MSEMFNYVSGAPAVDQRMISQPPIWSDFDPNSKMAVMARNAKQVNDSNFWNNMRQVFEHDLNTLPIQRVKVWASSLIVPIVSRHRVYEQLGIALREAKQYPDVKEALEEPMVGCTPADFDAMFRVVDNYNITMNRAQAYYGLTYGSNSEILDKASQINSVVELGAGIGDMADVFRKLGFAGSYTIFDFPELLEIQKWYHQNINSELHRNNKYTADVNELSSADLVIATWSLTEMPLELRDNVVSKLIDTPRWLIAFSNSIFGIDNNDWIMNVLIPKLGAKPHQISLKEVRYDNVPWEHWDGGTYYLYIDKTL